MPHISPRLIITIVVSIIVFILVIGLVIYFWPHRSSKLETARTSQIGYTEAGRKINDTQRSDRSRSDFEQGCESKVYDHGSKTKKTVVMFHGITACPKQFEVIAQHFYDAGYNVYVPLAPHHGTTKNPEATSPLTTQELTDYVAASYTIASGLGDEVGFVGVSGGGVLATWGAQYIKGVARLLVLSPFYEPSVQALPKWQIPALLTLYGYDLLPDRTVQGFSTRALAKYLLVSANYRSDLKAPGLKHVAVVTSEGDTQVDLNLADTLPSTIAAASGASLQHTRFGLELGLGHDIVSPGAAGVSENQAQLNDLYLSFYENRPPATEL